MDKSEVCLNVQKPVEAQPPRKSSKTSARKSFKQEFTINSPLDANVLDAEKTGWKIFTQI